MYKNIGMKEKSENAAFDTIYSIQFYEFCSYVSMNTLLYIIRKTKTFTAIHCYSYIINLRLL